MHGAMHDGPCAMSLIETTYYYECTRESPYSLDALRKWAAEHCVTEGGKVSFRVIHGARRGQRCPFCREYVPA